MSNNSMSYNTGFKGFTAKDKTLDMLKWILIIVVAILLIVLIVKLIEWATGASSSSLNSPILISGTVDANNSTLQKKTFKVPNSTVGLAYTYSLWIYVADWNYNFGNYKNVLVRGNISTGGGAVGIPGNNGTVTCDEWCKRNGGRLCTSQGGYYLDTTGKPTAVNCNEGVASSKAYNNAPNVTCYCETKAQMGKASPEISFYPDINNLRIRVSTMGDGDDEFCDIKNFPLQKWVNLVVVLNNRTLDTYVNGKLERSCVFKNVPYVPGHSDVKFVQPVGKSKLPGFFGKLSNCQYFNYAVQQNEILKLYSSGPYETAGTDMVFFKDGKFVQFKDENDMSGQDYAF